VVTDLFVAWLIENGVGPAAAGLPVNWAAGALASAARRWFGRFRHADDLSRLVKAATGSSVDLTRAEFAAVRRLLEDPQTWDLVGRGTVQDLAAQIASCLALRDKRTDVVEGSALTIARGLLEFAVADLEPGIFQRLLLSRLQRIETNQASALDEAFLSLHADLATHIADLKRVLEWLPPGPAQRSEVMLYLRTLIDWLSTDPWPRDRRFNGPVLTPAMLERKLLVVTTSRPGERDLDADRLAQHCQRLVVLGDPGSGKTWLAKRTARRCAEEAVEALAAGATADEVELPLYTTCSRLFAAHGDIREAAVSSALEQLSDLGSSRISAALRALLTERTTRTLLVIDSLDEAHGRSDRLRQARTLPWRIVLTSRPASWNQQLDMEDGDDAHQVGYLRPLRYPDDVEPFIHQWFAHQPEWGTDLAAQIARRPGLQQAATVPLVLAFYCIVGGREPLPDFRRDLFTKVLNRVLTGRWRGNEDRRPDASVCLQALRGWAWLGAQASHPVSGIGIWADDIPTGRVQFGRADQDALDHVAAPAGPPDVDTGVTLRRFIHRSLREHLVAGHVAGLPVDQAAQVLLPHLWYDPDWEYSAPAALAAHPDRDQLVRELICRAACSDGLPEDLSSIDAGWEFRKLLTRVMHESRESNWSPEVAGIIGRARAELAGSGRVDELGGTASWEASNRQTRDVMIKLLGESARGWKAENLVSAVVRLAYTAEDKHQALTALLKLLPALDGGHEATRLVVGGVIQLASAGDGKRGVIEALLRQLADRDDGPGVSDLVAGLLRLISTAEERRKVRAGLMRLLAAEHDSWAADELAAGVIRLGPTQQQRRVVREALQRLLPAQSYAPEVARLGGRLVQLAATAEEKGEVRTALLGLLADCTDVSTTDALVDAVMQLDPTAEDTNPARDLLISRPPTSPNARLAARSSRLSPAAQDEDQEREGLLALLASADDGRTAAGLAYALTQLTIPADTKRPARAALLRLLTDQTNAITAVDLTSALRRLRPAAQERQQARAVLLRLLTGKPNGREALRLADGLVHLGLTGPDKRQARNALLLLQADQTDSWLAVRLASRLRRLHATEHDKRQACAALLRHLTAPADAFLTARLLDELTQLDPTASQKREARDALTARLAKEASGSLAATLADGLLHLTATVNDKRAARNALLALLAIQTDIGPAGELTTCILQLDLTPQQRRRARRSLLTLLTDQISNDEAERLVEGACRLAPAAEDKKHTRYLLLELLADQTSGSLAAAVIDGVVRLSATAASMQESRARLLKLLARRPGDWVTNELAGGRIRLDPTADDKRRARAALLELLTCGASGSLAARLLDLMAKLDPTAQDIIGWCAWEIGPTEELLTAVRRNSTLADWLANIPALASLSSREPGDPTPE
jgi:hypothetical protein